MKNKIKDLILAGNFAAAKRQLSSINREELEIILFEIGSDEENLCAYTFVCFLLFEDETADYHYLASELLNISFCYMKGAYQTALCHIRRAIELSPNDVLLKEAILLFRIIPEKLLHDKEARQIAKKILSNTQTIRLH